MTPLCSFSEKLSFVHLFIFWHRLLAVQTLALFSLNVTSPSLPRPRRSSQWYPYSVLRPCRVPVWWWLRTNHPFDGQKCSVQEGQRHLPVVLTTSPVFLSKYVKQVKRHQANPFFFCTPWNLAKFLSFPAFSVSPLPVLPIALKKLNGEASVFSNPHVHQHNTVEQRRVGLGCPSLYQVKCEHAEPSPLLSKLFFALSPSRKLNTSIVHIALFRFEVFMLSFCLHMRREDIRFPSVWLMSGSKKISLPNCVWKTLLFCGNAYLPLFDNILKPVFSPFSPPAYQQHYRQVF